MRFAAVAGVILLLLFGAFRVVTLRTGIPGWSERTTPIRNQHVSDEAVRAAFKTSDRALDAGAYETAFGYLLEGFVHYRSPLGARVYYPGTPSKNGRSSDGLEGYARFFPLAAAWLASGRRADLRIAGDVVSIPDLLRDGLLAGTDRDGPEFWGVIRSADQRLVESATTATFVTGCRRCRQSRSAGLRQRWGGHRIRRCPLRSRSLFPHPPVDLLLARSRSPRSRWAHNL